MSTTEIFLKVYTSIWILSIKSYFMYEYLKLARSKIVCETYVALDI